ncbi:15418_t:CDS:2 [Dentiscutata erythropus]|uniref:15418_t:CDS:1 n=1 Tax=Dentiscutata erythropus TaxID=1348616 RepID=A0A9N9HZ80_9GLOM|nr:15418_t:CDS:2 [Dentiscutata erythropus]
MAFWVFLVIVSFMTLIYKYITSKLLDDLKNIHTISLFSILLGIITKQGGKDKYYSNYKKYFENDGIVKIWKRHRRICNPAFKALPIHLFVDTGLKLMRVLEKIDDKPVEIRDLLQRFTLDTLGKVAFDFDFNNLGNPNNIYVKTYNKVHEFIVNPLRFVFPIDYIPGIRQQTFSHFNKLIGLFKEIIKKKHEAIAAGKSNGDLLEYMIKNNDDQMLSDSELRYNLAVFMMAGHNTTLNALTAILYLLSIHKDVQEKAREEILRILGDNLTPSIEQQNSLKYLNMIINESFRLYPPVPSIFRELTEDLKFKNSVIPAGTIIELFLYGMHHSPKIWNNPEKFLPERFENQHTGENNFWMPFGYGYRMLV